MRTVGIRELKNRLSEYIRLVRRGEDFLVTDHGQVVAQLCPPGSDALRSVPYPGLVELARQGRARLGAPNRPELYPERPVRMPDGTSAALIDEDRNRR